MKNYRAARKNIDPELLENIRVLIAEKMQEGALESKQEQTQNAQLKIDRRKNLQTIQKVLELTSHQTDFQQKIKKMLVEILH
jgi:hypothetical protein